MSTTLCRSFAPRGTLFGALPAFLGAVLILAGSPRAANAQTWNLVWSDEFNGSGQADASNWAYELGNNGGWGNGELENYTVANGQQTGGHLNIQARADLTSARLKTQGKRQFGPGDAAQGRFEASISLNKSQGIWPAFWMLGIDIATIPWPDSGEIDILEAIDNVNTAFTTIHWNSGGGHAQWGPPGFPMSTWGTYHNYAITWTPTEIRWWLDGATNGSADITINSTEEFHRPFFALLNVAIGGAWPGNPDGTTVYPANMNVDYVRWSQAAAATPAPGTLLSQGRPAFASSIENADSPVASAFDGNTATRWSSAFSDPQWIYVDLGAVASITRVDLNWEAAYATAYQIQISSDAATWASVYSTTTGAGGLVSVNVSGNARYVRMYGTARATQWGYSLYELQVFGNLAATPTATAPPATATATARARATATSRARATATARSRATATATPTATATARTTATSTATPIPSATSTPTPTACGAVLLSRARPVTASSSENAATAATNAVDGNLTTRWSSAFSDPQWIYVDLGATQSIGRVVLNWEAAFGRAYQIQTSTNASTWTNIYSTTTGDGGIDDLVGLTASGRYVRMYGTARATTFGYSLWEMEVYSPGCPTPRPTVTPTPGGPVNFGPNVTIFDPGMSAGSIQSQINTVYNIQHTNQFGNQRYALLFRPGTYNVQVPLGFYTQVAGLGINPDDVLINGNIDVRADWLNDGQGHCCNATQNFWRAAENLATAPSPSDGSGWSRWAVSQAAPFRRIHIRGSMFLWDGGWASGGYIADTVLDGWTEPGSQQQWYTRNSNLVHGWGNAVWNHVIQGSNNPPDDNAFPGYPVTTIATTPIIREKPFLYINGAGQYNVFVPALRSNALGVSWPNAAGTSIPISNFFIVRNDNFSVPAINAALAGGQHLLITPGVYHLTESIQVTQPNTVVLGLGLATLVADNGAVALRVADIDGVKIAHLLIEGGSVMSPVLMEVGPSVSGISHFGNPTSLSDVFLRLGGDLQGQADIGLTINSNDVIVDHTWLWRADHGVGVGWNVNVGNQGLVVNGNNVTVYGLFAEHFEKYNVLWNGNNGRTYFLQNEFAYDVPNQAAWMDGSSPGYAAYKVANTVTNHQAWGVGSYCLFLNDTNIHAAHGFETPTGAGIHFHHLVTISLGYGFIDHIVNNVGDQAAPSLVVPHYLVDYP